MAGWAVLIALAQVEKPEDLLPHAKLVGESLKAVIRHGVAGHMQIAGEKIGAKLVDPWRML
jgi:hypothetical protein